MEGTAIGNTPDMFWQVADICNIPKFCMQRHIFVIVISRFFFELSIISPQFFHISPGASEEVRQTPFAELVPVPLDHTRSTF